MILFSLFFSYFEVALNEPRLFPWKPPIAAIMVRRPVASKAIFNAPSTDSVPLFVKNAYFKFPGVNSAKILAK